MPLFFKTAVKGFLLGMTLQLSIGPVCLFLLKVSVTRGFSEAFAGVLAAAAGDLFYVALALFTSLKLLRREKSRKIFQRAGSLALFLFALETGLGAFQKSLFFFLPSFFVLSEVSIFFSVLILTLSSPLTALFWAGIFSAKIMEENFSKPELLVFSAGALSATLIFLSAVIGAGHGAQGFFSAAVIQVLNLLVAIFLAFFAIKLFRFQKS